jgi:glycosyltransferase involved in cell wall biosynthesis
LVFPSECYETGALSIAEGFATGLPAIATDHGTMATMVRHRHNGLLFRPGDAASLASEINWFFNHEEVHVAMRRNARAEYERKYTKVIHYERLIAIYRQAMERAATE